MIYHIYIPESTSSATKFLDFSKPRIRAGVPIHVIIDAWNKFVKKPEDMVFLCEKSNQDSSCVGVVDDLTEVARNSL
jgi:hypothetical protein